MIARAIVVMLSFVWLSVANAEVIVPFDDGHDLKATCMMPKDHILFGLCLGIVSGYYESFRQKCRADSNSITRPQLVEIVLKFYQDNPERLRGPAFESASEALTKAFDCTR